MAEPLAGLGGKPIIGQETANKHFVGRIVVELFEGPYIPSDAHGLVMQISPSAQSELSQLELLKRIASALPDSAVRLEKAIASREHQ